MPVNITNRADAEAIIREQVISTIFRMRRNSLYLWLWRKSFRT